jgi:molybdenum cofactor cytidylyltransferase
VRFGPLPVADAEGAILAHAVTAGERRFRKAHALTADDIAALREAGISEVIAALLDSDDLSEDAAAERIAGSLLTRNVEARPGATGRVNLHGLAAGVFTVDKQLIDAINAVDPAITIATLGQHVPVEQGQMVATVKIIPFAVAAAVVEAAISLCQGREAFAVNSYHALKVSVVQTVLRGIKASVLDKTVSITQSRLSRSGSTVLAERRPPHETKAVAEAIRSLSGQSDMVVVFGASAMSDFDDVVPAAIREAGGTVLRAGMPVDPGNLIVLGKVDGKPVLGAPGCARSPKENGFDWVLNRLVAGIDVTDADIAGMGVGGLLMEIPSRPQPREAARREKKPLVHAIVLAAGRSSRMGGPNKLLALFGGEPLIRRMVERVEASRASGVTVVTGHQADRIRAALFGLDAAIVENADFATGLASSLKAGVAKIPESAAGALVVLGDMPDVSTADFDRLIAAFVAAGGTSVVRATHNGKRGNPVILPRSLFSAVARLEGDTGARHLVESEGLAVIDVEIGEGASVDVDTPDALKSAGGVLQD